MESLEEMSAKFGRGVKELGLDAIVVIGGDGSFQGAMRLCELGIPSNGMLISAVHHDIGEEKLHLLIVDPHIPAGAKLY